MLGGNADAKSQKLLRLAYDCLDQDRPEKALKLANRLWKLGNSGSAEIRARALWMLEEYGEAIRTLEVGTSRWPQVAILWSYLGEYLSNTGAYEEALSAFERAKTGLGGSVVWSEYNIALVLWRSGRAQEALNRVQRIPADAEGPPMALRKWVAACALIDLGRAQEALDAMEFVHEEHEKWVSVGTMSNLLETYAQALFGVRRSDEALRFAWEAIGLSKFRSMAAHVIRETSGEVSEHAKEWRIRIEGRHSGIANHEDPSRFSATYRVVADSPEEALELARRFEDEDVRASIVLVDAEVEKDAFGQKKGVAEALGANTFLPGA